MNKQDASNPAPTPSPVPIGLKTILVPVDFSDSARKALHYALAFARLFKAEVTILHVAPELAEESRVTFSMPELQQEILRDAAENLRQEIERADVSDLKVNPVVKKGTPYHEIVETATQMNADMIVIGTHGRTGLKHVLMGSTAERVVRHAPCPVLVVREREREFVAAGS
jgi:nucleotide-binding universal stress UspA family protein